MNKPLGIAIPYYVNSAECEISFKKLMKQLKEQVNDDVIIFVYEDGQISDWLKKYEQDNIIIVSCDVNKGVAYARNQCLEYLIDKVDYILYIDSDDRLDNNYIEMMLFYCKRKEYEIYESGFYVKNTKTEFNPSVRRCGVAGSAIQTKIIGDIRFDNHLQIGEDTKFMKDVFNLDIHKKQYVDTYYYYQLGINEKSLTMLDANHLIEKTRN